MDGNKFFGRNPKLLGDMISSKRFTLTEEILMATAALNQISNDIEEEAITSINSLEDLDWINPFELIGILRYQDNLRRYKDQNNAKQLLIGHLGINDISNQGIEDLKAKYHNFIVQVKDQNNFNNGKYVTDLFKIALMNSKITMKSPNYPMIKAFILSDFGVREINDENAQWMENYERLFEEQIKDYVRDISNGTFNAVDTPVDYYGAIAFLIENAPKEETQALIAESISRIMPDVINRDKLIISNFIRDIQTKKVNMDSSDYEHNKNIVMVHGSEASKKFVKEYETKEMISKPSSNLTTTEQVVKSSKLEK